MPEQNLNYNEKLSTCLLESCYLPAGMFVVWWRFHADSIMLCCLTEIHPDSNFERSLAGGNFTSWMHLSASWASLVHWAAKKFASSHWGRRRSPQFDSRDPAWCAVGDHLHGHFMAAHLLSHTSLFAAGVGRSSTMPISFQCKDRSISEAQNTYTTMSPLMHVKKYPLQERVCKLFLIHAEVDDNSGTHRAPQGAWNRFSY
jgi:hypothetical protein